MYELFEDISQNRLLFRPYLDRKQGLTLKVFDDATPAHDHDDHRAARADIFYLLQLLIPGMLLIVHDTPNSVHMANHGNGGGHGGGSLPQEDFTRAQRSVPPAPWILDNARVLQNIFGRGCFRAFRECAVNRSNANWTTVYAYTAN